MTLEELQVLITAETSGLKKELNSMKSQMNTADAEVKRVTSSMSSRFSMLGKAVKTVIGLFATKKIIDFGSSSVRAFNTTEIAAAKLQQVMRNTMGATNDQIKSANDLIAVQEAVGVVSKDVQTAAAQEISTYLTQANSLKTLIPVMNDMVAQQYGLEASAEAATNIATMMGKVMDGQVGGLSRYGYSFTEAQERILKYGTEAERAATLAEVVRQSVGGMNEALARTPAGQMQQLKNSLSDVKEEIGKGIMSAIQAVMPYLNMLAGMLMRVAQVFSAFMQAIFGKTAQVQTKAIIQQTGAVSGLGDAVAGAGKKAKKAAKDAKGALAGFDEINSLSNQSGSAGAGAGGGGGIGGLGVGSVPDINIPMPSMDINPKVAEAVKNFLEPLKNFNFKPLLDSLGRLKDALLPIGQDIWAGLMWGYNNILVPLAKFTIEKILPTFFDLLSGALTILDPILKSVGAAFAPFYESVLKPIAAWTGEVIVEVLRSVADVLDRIGKWMSSNQPTVNNITKAVLSFMAAWKVVEILSFIQQSGGVIKAIKDITAVIKAGTVAKLADKAETAILNAMYAKDLVVSIAKGTAAFIANTAKIVAQTVAQLALTVATGAWNLAVGIATAATWLFNAALAVLTSPITLVIAAIAALIAGIYLLVKNWDTVKAVGAAAWAGIQSAWSVAYGWFSKNITAPIGNLFTNLFSGIKNGLKSMVNFLITGLNALIGGLNKLKFKLPDWMGGQSFGINIPKIPYLARGGIIDQPTLAMVGERGKEAVVPLENNTAGLDLLAEKLLERLGGIGTTSSSSDRESGDVIIRIGETEFARIAIAAINKAQRQAGKTLIIT